MFVQIKRIVVKEGNSDKVMERFGANPNGPSLLEQQPGFIDKQVLVKKVRRGDEEVLVMVRWESEEAWKIGRRVLSILQAIRQAQVNRSLIISLKADKKFIM